MSEPHRPPRGSQNERTALAWQRTALSIGAGAVVLTRLTLDRIGAAALLALVAALPVVVAVGVSGRGRYRFRGRDATSPPPGRTPWLGGIPPLAMALAITGLGLVELAALFVS